MIVNFVAKLENLYSCFCFLLQSFSYFFISTIWEKCWKSKTAGGATASVAALKPCINEDYVKNGRLIKGDVEIVMEKLGISWDWRADGVDQERISDSSGTEISNLFDQMEPSLEEVKEAFDLFDSDKDGYIGAKDLEKILCAFGFVDFKESECQKMIMASKFNINNGTGKTRIDFRNFVKIIEDSFS